MTKLFECRFEFSEAQRRRADLPEAKGVPFGFLKGTLLIGQGMKALGALIAHVSAPFRIMNGDRAANYRHSE